MKKYLIAILFVYFVQLGNTQVEGFSKFFLYQITPEEAIELAQQDPFDPGEEFFHTLADSSASDQFYEYASGHFLLVQLKSETVQVKLLKRNRIHARILEHKKNLVLEVIDSTGKIIEDASVKLGKKTIAFDPKTKTYRKNKWKKKDSFLLVEADGEHLYFNLTSEKYKNHYYRNEWWRKLNPVLWAKSLLRKIRRNKRTYKGYMVLNKPQYRPGDTLKVKGYFTNKKGKPLEQDLILSLYNKGKVAWQQTIRPETKGCYLAQIVLVDSLDLNLDDHYRLVFQDQRKKRKIQVFQHHFLYEDYELDEAQYTLNLERSKYEWGTPIEIEAIGQYKTGLYLPDATVTLKLYRSRPNRVPFADAFFDQEVVLKKDIWTHQQKLDSREPTKIIIPDSIFPKAMVGYTLEAAFTDSSGELHEKDRSFNIVRPNALLDCVELVLEGAYVVARYTCADSLERRTAILENDFDEWDRIRKIQLPFRERVQGASYDYDLTFDDETSVYLDLEEYQSEVQVFGENRRDSLLIELHNPRQLPIHYELYCGKKRVDIGQTDAAFFPIARKGDQKNYRLYYQYDWAASTEEQEESFVFFDKKLAIEVEQKTKINPGETVQIKVKVKNSKGKAAANVDLTAGAVNGQFKELNHFKGPMISYKESKVPNKKRNYSLQNYRQQAQLPISEYWVEKLATADQLFYQLRYPKKGVHLHEEKLTADTFYQNIAQFAPYIVRDGKAQPIYLIYANRKLVYYYNVHDNPPYSFIGRDGKNEIRIRTRDAEYTFKDVVLKNGHKLEFSIDENHYLKSEWSSKIKRIKRSPKFNNQETTLLNKSIFVLKNKQTGIHILKQGDQNIHLLSTQRYGYNKWDKYFRVGPFDEKIIDYHWYENVKRSIDFESGFSYSISHNRERLYEYQWINTVQKLPLSLPVKMPGALVLRPVDIRAFDYLPIKIPYAAIGHQSRHEVATAYVYKAPKYPERRLMCVLQRDTGQLKIYPLRTNSFQGLTPGNYRLYLINEDGSYLKHQFEIVSKQILFQDLSKLSFKADTTYTLLESVLPKELQTVWAGNMKEMIQQEEKRKAMSTGRFVFGETNLVRGIVFDGDTGEPLIGASVWERGTGNGTITNINGTFELEIPPRPVEIEISYTGYESQIFQLPIQPADLSIVLTPGMLQLEAVIVVGYAESRNNTLSSADIRALPTRNIQALAATTAGLSVVDDGDVLRIHTRQTLKGYHVKNPLPDGIQLRNQFRDYAYWQPSLSTDENGEAWFTVQYPDNTTQWKNYVIGMNDKEEVGISFTEVNAFKQVMARLSVPRFLVEGDQTNILGKSLNYRGDTLKIESQFKVDGAVVKSTKSELSEAVIEQTSVTAPPQDSLQMTYTLTSNNYGDGEEYTIPIFPKGVEEIQGGFYLLDSDTTFQLTFDPENGPVYIHVEQSVVDILEESIDYLIQYPHGCNEQVASRLTATLLAKEIKRVKGEVFEKESFIRKGIKTLVKRQNSLGFWGWWKEAEPDIWMTTYVLKILHNAQQQGYNIPALDKGLVYLTNQLEKYEGRDLLNILELFSDVGQNLDYESQLARVAKMEKMNLNDELTILKIRQAQKLDYSLAGIMSKMKTSVYGGSYWGDVSHHWYDNDIQITLLAYEIFKRENRPAVYRSIERYLLHRRSRQAWRNTIETARVVAAILPDYLDAEGAIDFASNLSIGSGDLADITKFPFTTKLLGTEKMTVRKKGKVPLYFTAYQKKWNPAPKIKSDYFEIKTTFEQNENTTQWLRAGEKASIEVSVDVKQMADYLLLDVPIPAGCSYGEKQQNYPYQRGETHREYFKDRVAIYCKKLNPGKYYFTINLEPRFTGTYTLNPAKMEEMYFPVFYGRNELKKVMVKD